MGAFPFVAGIDKRQHFTLSLKREGEFKDPVHVDEERRNLGEDITMAKELIVRRATCHQISRCVAIPCLRRKLHIPNGLRSLIWTSARVKNSKILNSEASKCQSKGPR